MNTHSSHHEWTQLLRSCGPLLRYPFAIPLEIRVLSPLRWTAFWPSLAWVPSSCSFGLAWKQNRHPQHPRNSAPLCKIQMEQSKIGKVIHAEASKVIHTAKVERHQQSPISMHGRLISRRRKNLSDIREHFKGSHQFFRISIQMPIESYMPKIAKEYLFGLKLESRYSDVGHLPGTSAKLRRPIRHWREYPPVLPHSR